MKPVTCPLCGGEITKRQSEQIEKQLEGEIESRFQKKWESEKQRLEQRRAAVEQKEQMLQSRSEGLEHEVERKVREQVTKREQEIIKQAVRDKNVELQAAKQRLSEYEQKEATLLAKEGELAKRERQLDLRVSQRVNEQLAVERKQLTEDVSKSVADGYRLRLQEKDHLIASLQKNLDEAQRQAAQGSAQLRGELEEEDLEAELKKLFPNDSIEPVVQGKPGADILQIVHDRVGRVCGSILWESKQTKMWSDGWLPKLREDQRSVTADLAVLVTRTLPSDVAHFSVRERVLITRREFVPGIAELLRSSLISLSNAKTVAAQREQKTELLYEYITSKEFTQKIGGIVDAHLQLQELLEQEQKALRVLWGKRAKLQALLVGHVARLYGEVSVLVGALPPIKGLELLTTEEPIASLEFKEQNEAVEVEQSEPPF